MTDSVSLHFKIADQPWEYEAVHALNYRTFVEEITQHAPNDDKKLVDKFHSENTYIIGLSGMELLAMLALRDQRPFSLDHKLDDLDQYLPAIRPLCEIRLLAVASTHRHRIDVFRGLLEAAAKYAFTRGWQLAVISGTLRQQRLYTHLGFIPFGPVVGTSKAAFQPMYWTLSAVYENLAWLSAVKEKVIKS